MNEKYMPSVKLISHLANSSRIIAVASKATLSAKDYDGIDSKMDDGEVSKWLTELVKRGHGSPLEHSLYVFEVVCSRVCSHQLVRHRHASFTQLSQRYSDNYLRTLVKSAADKLGIADISPKPKSRSDHEQYASILLKYLESEPDYDNLLEVVSEAFIVPPHAVKAGDAKFLKMLIRSVSAYYEALASGYPPEDARFLLPQAVKTRLIVSMNARELFEVFLPLRMCSRAQWEIRYVAWSMWRMLNELQPELFGYVGPRCVIAENRIRAEPCRLLELLDGRCQFTLARCPELVNGANIPACLRTASKSPWETA